MAGLVQLVLDTATSRTTIALRRDPGAPIEEGSASGPERGAAALGSRLSDFLSTAGRTPADLGAVGVGTGPGSFTGLRVGMMTAKTLAWSLGIPLVGIPTFDALRRAGGLVGSVDPDVIAVIQAAGARDHYLALPGEPPRLVPPGIDLADVTAGHPVIALDTDPARLAGCHGPGGGDPLAAGAAARDGLGSALLAILAERLAAGATDDVGELVPVYVALPRGIGGGAGAAWTPEIR